MNTEFLKTVAVPLEIGLLVTALIITTTASVDKVIFRYRLQSVLLAIVTGLAALTGPANTTAGSPQFAGLIVVLPLVLAALVRWLLKRATRNTPQEDAEQVWRDSSEGEVNTRTIDVAVFLLLIAVAFLIAGQLAKDVDEQVGLLVSLALPFIGMYNMVAKRDIISQIVGLLVMDHGLYLAAVKVAAIPTPATFFVVSLYFYTLITIAILVFLLPQVRRVTDKIDLGEIARESRLKG